MQFLKFRLRTLLVLTFVIAVSLGAWLERQRYLRTHVFVDVVDSATGVRLSRFQYRFGVISATTKPDRFDLIRGFGEWVDYHESRILALSVPEHCEVHISVRALDLDGGFLQTDHTQLILPEISHAIAIRMTQGQQLDGVVLDSETKQPIKDAVVQVTSVPDSLVLTDAFGKFKLRHYNLKFGVLAYHPHFAEQNVVPESNTVPVTIELKKARRITGKVICRETGNPVSECDVAQPDRTRWSNRGHELYTTTDDQGNFETFIDESMHEVLEVRKYDSLDDIFVDVTGTSEITIPVDLYPFTVSGRVVDETGQAVTDYYMRIDSPSLNDEGRHTEMEHVSDSNGAFLFRRKNPIVSLSVGGPCRGPLRRDVLIPSGSKSVELQTIVLPKGITLRGKVTDSKDGVPVELQLLNQERSLFANRPIFEYLYTAKAEPDEHGNFLFENVSTGRYTLLTKYNGFWVDQRPVLVKDEPLALEVVELPKTGRISGVAKGEEGLTARFQCFYLGTSPDDSQFWLRTNHLGEFQLDHVPVGRHGLGRLSSWPESPLFEISVTEGRTTRVSFEETPMLDIVGVSESAISSIDLEYALSGSDQQFAHATKSEKSPSCFLGRQLAPGEYDASIKYRTGISNFSAPSAQHIDAKFSINTQKKLDVLEFRERSLRLDFAEKKVRGLDLDGLYQHGKESHPFYALSNAKWSEDTNELVAVPSQTDATDWNEGDHITSIFLMVGNRVQSKIELSELDLDFSILLEQRNPDTCLLHNPQLGWARVGNLEIGSTEILAKAIRFQPGATLKGTIRFEGLDILPTAIAR